MCLLLRCFWCVFSHSPLNGHHLWSSCSATGRITAVWNSPAGGALLQPRDSTRSLWCQAAAPDPCWPLHPGPGLVWRVCVGRSRREGVRKAHRACLRVPETSSHTLHSPAGAARTQVCLPPAQKTWLDADHTTETGKTWKHITTTQLDSPLMTSKQGYYC